MATTRQLLRILLLSLSLNLIHFSTSLQINSLHQLHQQVLCPEDVRVSHRDNSEVFGPTPMVPLGSEIDDRSLSLRCPLVSDLYIGRCGAVVPLMSGGRVVRLISTPQFVEWGWYCLHTRRSGDTCIDCLCAMFHTNHHLQDMVYALYEIYFGGGDASRVIGEKMLGNIPLDQFVTNPDPLSGVEILPVQRLNDLANINATKDMAWAIQTCLRDSPIIWLSPTDDERKDVEEANLQRWSSCYAQGLKERKDLEEANLQRWASYHAQQSKVLPSITFIQLTHYSYTTRHLDRSPRDWAIEMFLYASAAGIPSNSQLFKVWVRFQPSLRRDIPMPNWTTRMVDFLDHIDEMYPIWITRKQDAMMFSLSGS